MVEEGGATNPSVLGQRKPRTGLCSEHTGFCIEEDCPKRARTRSGRCLAHDILDRNRHFHEVEELHANAVAEAEAEAAVSGALSSIERMLSIDEDHSATLEDDSNAIILHSHHHENDSAHVHEHGAAIVDTSSHESRYMDAEADADLSEARDYEFHNHHHHHHHQDHHHHLHHHHHESHDHTLQVPEIQEAAAREGSQQNDVRIAEDEDLAEGHAVVLPAQTSNDHHVDQVNETDQDDLDAKEHEAHVKLSFYLTNQVAGPQGSLAETNEADPSASHMHDPLHIHDHDHFDRIQRPSEVQDTNVSCTGADTLHGSFGTHEAPGMPNEEEVLENENQHGEARLHQTSELDSTDDSVFISFDDNESEEVSISARPLKRPRV
ncbi:Hypothetical Protein FCC1311_034002 [Hondaea fermentalgiana]|uniref:Uncharacterized protein n=1 Tax=Hondaea fermentalgiana TaxID=2315210 RepID=A0A2R5G810_9STRA|nr:Hypothetical Protein FCC1311_034002 [Hondaea fermentalgiana]|eukprot:GBG27177.1 Hypothetical Protein FCC1311_034002 [Hondaea fermentalgiana]